jgi:hypothetical protein
MSTLTDRYVWGVVRAVPTAQRADLEPEIRALIGDAVDARVAAGVQPREAERAAIVELGDPERLAARYTDKSLFLIGPRLFPDWKRLLSVLLPIVVPITGIAVAGAGFLAGNAPAEAIATGVSTAFTVGVMLTFWVTVVFAIMERRSVPDLEEELVWSPDRLPELPKGSTVTLVETAVSVAMLALAATLLVWQQTGSLVTIGGVSYPLFNADLWSFWLPWFLGLIGAQILFKLALFLRHGWTWGLAVVNAVLDLAFIVPGIWLWSEGRLFDPDLVTASATLGVAEAMRPAGIVIAVVMVAAVGWDIVEGFLNASRASRPQVIATRSR